MFDEGVERADAAPERASPHGRSQALWGGITFLALSGAALWTMQALDTGSLATIGPGGVPRTTAIFVGTIGLVLIALGLSRDSAQIGTFGVRGVVVVLIAIAVFAVTLRPFSFGAWTTPGLGLVGAGPLCIFIAGFATNEVRWRDLAVLACILTAFCMVLFGDLLTLPIPMFPRALAALFPSNWPQIGILRGLAACLVLVGIFILLAGRAFRTHAGQDGASAGADTR